MMPFKPAPELDIWHPSCVVTGQKITPVAIIGALVLMIGALLYAAFNRSHEVTPKPPMHQSR
jgi:hypothetical protein